jgi:hypothetical protein
MRKIALVSMIVLVGLLVGTSVAAARSRHNAPPKCPPANEGVVAADAQAVVYEAGIGVFGCAYGSRRSYRFGPTSYGSATSGSGGTSPIVLAGPVVAYDTGTSSMFGRSVEEIWVRNLRTGRLLHRMPNGSPGKPGDIGLGETTAIVVKGDGSVAWIVRAGAALGGIQVRSVDKTGSHVLAVSPEVDPDSLALAGSTLYWTQGGKSMSAKLD